MVQLALWKERLSEWFCPTDMSPINLSVEVRDRRDQIFET